MEITNARIKNVTVGFDDRNRLAVRMTFAGQYDCCDWGFILTDSTDVQRLMKLMNYTGAHEVGDLCGCIIRKVSFENFLHGFGHPIEDSFIPTLTTDFKEINEAQFNEMLKSN